MSGVFRAIGKVFKKVVKVVKKVALPALMIGAVVLTGGAALGALPAIGTVLGSVGISGTLASVLGGAISAGAVGAITGAAGAAIQGKNIFKGAVGGFTTGALTGGVLGAAGVISPNGILSDIGLGSQAAHQAGLQATGRVATQAATSLVPNAAQAVAPQATGGLINSASSAALQASASAMPGVAASAIPASLAPAATAAGATAAASTTAAGGGILNSALVPSLVTAGGQLLSGFAQGAAAGKAAQEAREQEREEYDRVAYNYGYRNIYNTDKKGRTVGGIPIRQEQAYTYSPFNPSFPTEGLLAAFQQLQQQPTPYYQIINGQVVATAGA